MVRKAVLGLFLLLAAMVAAALGLYLTNGAPDVAAVSAAEMVSGKPVVIKMHAQWCPKCMLQKGVWSDIEKAYGGQVNLVVMDFTDGETTAATEREARRLGLASVFEEYAGATGFVVVLNRKHEFSAEVGGRDFEAYRAAIDAALVDMVIAAPPGE